mgnify:CR=1 FL=1
MVTASEAEEKSVGHVIRWNTTDPSSRPVIYHCAKNDGDGYGEMKAIMASIVPEYELQRLPGAVQNLPNRTNEYDI